MQDQANRSKAEARLKAFDELKGNRGNFENQWKEIAERCLVNDAKIFQSMGIIGTQGDKRTAELFDSTASIALSRFTAILDSLLTPRNQTWQRLAPSNPYLKKDRNVNLWFEEVTRLLFKYRYSPNANFSAQNQQVYQSIGAYGTGALFIDKLDSIKEQGIRYKYAHLSGVYFAENHQGIIDKAYRHFRLSARQALQKFGKENLPEKIIKSAISKPEDQFFFLHCIAPKDEYDPSRLDFRGKPYSSEYIAVDDKKLVAEDGYTSFPYAISRYYQAEGECYGRSIAMELLPAMKTLNEQKKTVLKQGHRALDPILLVHDDGIVDSFSFKPGAINAGGVSAEGRPLVHPLPTGSIVAGKELMDDERAVINDGFLITLFQILTENPEMTATEVVERAREKGILLAPTVGRQQDEYLGPMTDREIDVLSSQGLLPPMPPALIEAEGEYTIIHDSPMSRTQRMEEASGLMRTMEMAINYSAQTGDRAPLDHFNFDEIIPDVASIQGVNSKWMNSLEAVQAKRQAQAEAQQTQQEIEAAPGVAAIANATTKARQGA